MRVQRRSPVTVTLVHATATSDMGNDETTATGEQIQGALFTPEQIVERAGNDQTPVTAPAFFDLPGVFAVDADDLVHVTDSTVPDDQLLTITADTWQVVGGGAVWRDRTKVPVSQARKV